MCKIIFLFFFSFVALIVAGCKGDTEDPLPVTHSNSLTIEDLSAPYQDGNFSFSIKADWTTSEGTRIATFTVSKKSNPTCTYTENNITVNRAIPLPINKIMSNFGSCFVPGLTYTLLVHVDGLTDASTDFDWSNTVNPATIMIGLARQWKTGITIPFYEPPSWFNDNVANLKNISGSVAWTSRGLTNNYHTETKDSYICRLTDASRNNPQNWNQYVCEFYSCFSSTRSGIPFPSPFTPYSNTDYDELCNCGFICYSFVYAVAKAAGYRLFTTEPVDVAYFTAFSQIITHSDRKIGDVVLYDFNLDQIYDHVAIITQKNSIKIEDDMVISTLSQHEIFLDGVAEIKLGAFHSVNQGGVFTNNKWISLWDSWTTTSNIKIFRLH